MDSKHLTNLPPEIIRNIAIFLKTPFNLFLTCKRFVFLIEDKQFWQQLYERDYIKRKVINPNYKADPKLAWKREWKKSTVPNKRIMKEIRDLQRDPPSQFSTGPADESDLYYWTAFILGPENTPYQDGVFQVEIFLPETYPFRPPKNRFVTKMYHPNIDRDGYDCLEITDTRWSPALTIANVIMALQSLIESPDADDPMEPEIAKVYKTNREQFNQNAKEFTEKYAM